MSASVSKVAIVGTGVIGASWSALFLARGYQVVATDPAPGAEERLGEDIATWWPSLERQGMVVAGATADNWSFVASAAEAVEHADFVQENGPERLDVKHELYAEITASAIQQACANHPERVVIGHPFNPPHLVPLVEVVAGEASSDAALDAAMMFYETAGKTPIRINTELPGHVTNRLQAALWREAYWLVEQGACSVADIDKAISSGPGLRWALLGPFATQHVSGGRGGIEHVLEHLGPPMVDWWNTAEQAEWTTELKQAVVDGVDQELDGIDQAKMIQDRDQLLEQLIVAKAGAANLPGAQSTPSEPTEEGTS